MPSLACPAGSTRWGVRGRISLVGAPSDVGAAHRGATMGPEALRVADIAGHLSAHGYEVHDRGDVRGPRSAEQPAANGSRTRNLEQTVAWCRGVADQVGAALGEGSLPIMMGGDHSLAVGSIAAVARHCAARDQRLAVVWLDAHADYNTHESTPSGNTHGMPVAAITGEGPEALTALGHATPMVDPGDIIQVGLRSIDDVERRRLEQSAIAHYEMHAIARLGIGDVMRSVLARIPEDCHLHVSLDVDFCDPSYAPGVGTTEPGGPTLDDARHCLQTLGDTGRVGSIDIVELNPAFDHRNATAELMVDLVRRLL